MLLPKIVIKRYLNIGNSSLSKRNVPNTLVNIFSNKVTYNNGQNSVNFRDSLLILPSSLKKLAKSFGVDDKGLFPYSFATNDNLTYVGPVPDFKYFNGVSLEVYNEYKQSFGSKDWSMQQETIKYCELDCFVLYQVIDKFNGLIFELYELNVHRFPSLPSLAFGIYRSKYLKDFKVPLISGSMFHDLRKSYTGGAVDVYKCHGENLFIYDVNSLYPWCMMAYPVPVGDIKFFDGDITQILPWKDIFGFVQVEITAPGNLAHPIIQTKLQVGKAGLRTVAPLGTWTDWLFTEEIINAMDHGYTFKVIKGYTFDKANIFEDYIRDLYDIKAANHKDDPMYLIAKLLMNSLYGRFGMDSEFENHVIIPCSNLPDYHNKYNVAEWTQLDTQKVLVSYIDEAELEQKQLENYSTTNISIAIASSITAYARIHMSQFKNNPDYNLYYSDTDSIIIDKPLESYQVGPEIGFMKLENKLTEGTFIAPKVYGGIFEDGNSFTKIKGYKNKVDYLELKTLLNKDVKKLELTQEKWYRSIEAGDITIKDQIYSLQVTESKRQLVYSNDKLNNTIPFTINADKEIIK